MHISPQGLINMMYAGCLPMGISNYGGDIQCYNVPDYPTSNIGLCFNPQAQWALGGGGGVGYPCFPQLNLNFDVKSLGESFYAPVIENLAASNVKSNNTTIDTLQTKVQSLLEEEVATETQKTKLRDLLAQLEDQKDAMKALEDESLTNSDIYSKSDEITSKVKEISKEISEIEKAIKEAKNESEKAESKAKAENSDDSKKAEAEENDKKEK